MAQRYYNVKESAKLLGTSEENVHQMQERRELHGYRDGADWKFKAEDIEKLAAARKQQPPAKEDSEEHDEVLMSESELGQSSDAGASGTVIGMDDHRKKPESPAKFSDSDLQLDAGGMPSSVTGSAPSSINKDLSPSKVSQFEELDLTLDEDLTLEDSSVALGEKKKPATPGSSVVIASAGKKQDDDDLVLGGSGSGSGVTLGGDSGISLVDPADSGLSLEEPLEIGGSNPQESLELGEDEQASASDSGKRKSGVRSDDDFLLTPAEDAADLEDSESGSQVIALDTEGDEAATMIASRQGVSMAAMLEEDTGAAPAVDFGAAPASMAPMGLAPAAVAEAAAAMPPASFLPEAPYTTPQIVALAFCFVLLALCAMMMYELVRNLGSYNEPGGVPGWLIDKVANFF
jgi:excisionase family DNA binding protein